MPPKKRGKAKGKKGKRKKTSDGNELQEKYKRSTLDVAVLKEHLALRRDVARQAQACSHSLKSRLAVLEQELDEEREDKKDINADLTRQYKSMQMETGVRVHQLEIEVSRLRQQLALCQQDLQGEREERQRTVQEKDATIAELQGKIDNMETDYERILHDTLDSLLSRLAESKLRWVDESTALHFNNKERLADFGLNPLDI
ncbi:Coiled-coil domain-containing protein 153 [Acipenser ruthenus]|uniref:Dynein regulatory complex protein 12 n=1 Tax=Acipenser ruthenus TaxID=7906 RepID=A0A444V6R9_ACIRT|nr:coiled-coil domain-containing protein 153-like [Acipenser ruthenus]XP_058865719.1 coiled-coil domain-containing protein 153-like [Acipenser ruthenus]XP_058866212.1 coiled-coil domain-containing protein 153-like [Acipenser ruthenus]RXM96159.1 Coiled-coil domain-containing protein 153 [Acipenser ruthenus]